jgi:hypothetical protein
MCLQQHQPTEQHCGQQHVQCYNVLRAHQCHACTGREACTHHNAGVVSPTSFVASYVVHHRMQARPPAAVRPTSSHWMLKLARMQAAAAAARQMIHQRPVSACAQRPSMHQAVSRCVRCVAVLQVLCVPVNRAVAPPATCMCMSPPALVCPPPCRPGAAASEAVHVHGGQQRAIRDGGAGSRLPRPHWDQGQRRAPAFCGRRSGAALRHSSQ